MVSDQCHWPIAFMFMRRQYFKIRQCQLLFTTFVIISTMHVLLQKCSINLPLTLHSSNAAVSQSLWVIVQLLGDNDNFLVLYSTNFLRGRYLKIFQKKVLCIKHFLLQMQWCLSHFGLLFNWRRQPRSVHGSQTAAGNVPRRLPENPYCCLVIVPGDCTSAVRIIPLQLPDTPYLLPSAMIQSDCCRQRASPPLRKPILLYF